ncbi:MAG: hypothetical protein ACRD0K_23600 [Egibacteraceae bacterium]
MDAGGAQDPHAFTGNFTILDMVYEPLVNYGEDYTFFRASQVISEVNVVDPVTVNLVLSEPYPPLLQELSIVRPVRLLSPASVGLDSAFAGAVGTGPWQLESSSETGAVLVRYDGTGVSSRASTGSNSR